MTEADKKVLVLNGSPKGDRSNTMNFTRAFLKGLPETWSCTQINLCEKNITPCEGCFGCWLKTPGHCVIRDDMQEIYELINASDIIIESFPVHFFGMPVYLKAMTDRCLPLYKPWLYDDCKGRSLGEVRYEDLLRKKLVIISSCGHTQAEPVFDALRKQFELICYPEEFSAILIPEGEIFVSGKAARQINAKLEDVTNAGKEFSAYLKLSKETETKLSKPIIRPDSWTAIAASHWKLDGDF